MNYEQKPNVAETDFMGTCYPNDVYYDDAIKLAAYMGNTIIVNII